jgi:hypothetical protein
MNVTSPGFLVVTGSSAVFAPGACLGGVTPSANYTTGLSTDTPAIGSDQYASYCQICHGGREGRGTGQARGSTPKRGRAYLTPFRRLTQRLNCQRQAGLWADGRIQWKFVAKGE